MDKLSKDQKQSELLKYRQLVLATIDYYLDNDLMPVVADDLRFSSHFNDLKAQAELYFQKGSLGRLKQWFRDLSEMQLETRDLRFNEYLKEKTGYEVDIFTSFFQRINAIIAKGKITTDSQFYDVNMLVDELCQAKIKDDGMIETLNKLLLDYQTRRSSKLSKAKK